MLSSIEHFSAQGAWLPLGFEVSWWLETTSFGA